MRIRQRVGRNIITSIRYMNIVLIYHISDVIKRMRKYAWSDVSRSSIRFTYSSVARVTSDHAYVITLRHIHRTTLFLMREEWYAFFILCYFVWMTVWYAGWNSTLHTSKTKWCTKLVLFTRLYRDAPSTKHKKIHFEYVAKQALTLRVLMSYIYGAPILDVSRSHTTTQHSR